MIHCQHFYFQTVLFIDCDKFAISRHWGTDGDHAGATQRCGVIPMMIIAVDHILTISLIKTIDHGMDSIAPALEELVCWGSGEPIKELEEELRKSIGWSFSHSLP